MFNHIRLFLVFTLLCLPLNIFLRAFVWDSIWVIVATAGWFTLGQIRMFNGPAPATTSFTQAAKCSVMAMAWPLIPKRRSPPQ